MSEILLQITGSMRVSLIFALLFVLSGFEFMVPLVRSKRTSWLKTIPNLVMTVLLIFTNLLLSGIFSWVGWIVEANNFGLFQFVGQLPTAVMCIGGVMLLDFWAAWLPHFLLHKFPFLWRFHSVHHSDAMVDVTTAFRQHPVETIWRFSFYLTGMLLFGLPLYVLVLYMVLSATNAQLEHSNIRLPRYLDRALQWFIVTPNMHKVHHSKYQVETDSNYSNIFSVWDRLFGTFRRRDDYSTVEYGLDYLDKTDFTLRDLLVEIPLKKPSK